MQRIALAALALGALLVGQLAAPAAGATRLLGSDDVRVDRVLANSGGAGVKHCQQPERLPAGTNALLLSLSPVDGAGPAVAVELRRFLHGERRLASGRRAGGWTEAFVLVPLRRRVARAAVVVVCVTIAPGPSVAMRGAAGPPLRREEPNGPRIRVDDLSAAPSRGPARAPVGAAQRRALALLSAALALAARALGH